MDASPPPPHYHSHTAPGLLLQPTPDHMPPRLLSDEALAASIASLKLKLALARRTLLSVYIVTGALTLSLMVVGFVLLWYGPNSFLERVLGERRSNSTLGVIFWWLSIVAVAAVGGAMGDQVLRGKLRMARRWHGRVDDLHHRIRDAELVQRDRLHAAEQHPD